MKVKKIDFVQHLYHDIDNEDEAQDYLDDILHLIGFIIMYFNGLEQHLDKVICETFTDRSDSTGLLVLHRMGFSTKVELFKRFCDDLHSSCPAIKIDLNKYDKLISNLAESGRLRNLVAHADWENTDEKGYTFVRLKISKSGMEQEYVQFTEDSLKEIITLILKTRMQLGEYWEDRNEKLYRGN